ncbi:TetR family transcriptional regulator [Nocardia mangyaensis]|uniref:TetR family transcriptional regulator n=1 Tax=Nocardia mangyaensis TaxID=2213200 RepID=UPI00197FB535
MFLGQGYGATTLDQIAERAGVAVQTVTSTSATRRRCSRRHSTSPRSATTSRSRCSIGRGSTR